MDGKPIPKPRSINGCVDRPVPAPRRAHQVEITTCPTTFSEQRTQSPSVDSLKSDNDCDDERTNKSHCSSSAGSSYESKYGTNTEFFKNLGTSSRQLKDEISEKMTVKGRAVISSTRNASIRLEKSVKNLLTRRLSTMTTTTTTTTSTTTTTTTFASPLNQDYCQLDGYKLSKEEGNDQRYNQEDRCVSMPAVSANDIFSTLSFYSPLEQTKTMGQNVLRSVKNEDDLSMSGGDDGRYSPPPPIYPPPPLPDESIYDELQSVTSGNTSCNSWRYDTFSLTGRSSDDGATYDDTDAEIFDCLSWRRLAAAAPTNNDDDSDQSPNLSDLTLGYSIAGNCYGECETDERPVSTCQSRVSSERESVEKLSRSHGKTLCDRESDISECIHEAPLTIEKRSRESNTSQLSLPNSLYENWTPIAGCGRDDSGKNNRASLEFPDSMDVARQHVPLVSPPNLTEQSHSKINESLLSEFDPCAKNSNDNSANCENNDFMLLEELLRLDGKSAPGSSSESIEGDTRTEISAGNEEEEEEEEKQQPLCSDSGDTPIPPPPAPPRRYDSLPKNEYDEVELIQSSEVFSNVCGKNPALLPKFVHLVGRKQPTVPPRKTTKSTHRATVASGGTNIAKMSALTNSNDDRPSTVSERDIVAGKNNNNNNNNIEETVSRSGSVMQRLKKLGQDSTAHVKPNVINFMKSSKLLSRNRDNSGGAGIKRKNNNISHVMKRPEFQGQLIPVTHRGIVYRSGVGIERAKELVMRAAVLVDRKIYFYADKSMSALKEVVDLENVYSIHLLQDVKMIEGETVHCIAVSSEMRSCVFYAKGITERRIWAQRILEALTPIFPIKYTAELTRVGWAYLKEGVTGAWSSAWLLLQRRTLVYARCSEPNEPIEFQQVDLRKARCILLREQEGPGDDDGNGGSSVPVVVVDAGGKGAIHIATPAKGEGSAWRHALHQAATSCGAALDQQQLTQDNVPVVLDKCINFIYAHGIMSEGIYRRSGSSSAVVRLLEAFRRDAWATQITRGSYTEHDVATVLRRFLRDLPEPLLPSNVHDPLCRVSAETCSDEVRARMYAKILGKLDPVASSTLRRILAHLHCLGQQSARNLMTVDNISAVWGPTLMHAGEKSAEDWNRSETRVVGDMIRFYPMLYELSAADLAREAKILEVLERHHVSNSGPPRGAPSGDLKIWIHLLSKDGQCVNVTIGPSKTASDVCRELSVKAAIPAHELCLEELTLGGSLERPLHHSEKVLEVVARWGYWDPDDRRENILLLKRDTLYRDIAPGVKPPMTMSGELKFADTRTKNFKNHLFVFSQAKLCCYKDKMCSVKLNEWRIEDIVWYLGHEPKRNPQMGWSITFILKNKKPTRCKESPFFGNTLAGASVVERYKWLAAMIFGEHQMNLRPLAVNLMDT